MTVREKVKALHYYRLTLTVVTFQMLYMDDQIGTKLDVHKSIKYVHQTAIH